MKKVSSVKTRAEASDGAIARIHARRCKLKVVAVTRVEQRGIDRVVSYVGMSGRERVAKKAVWRNGGLV
jgi:hypothetical protein